MITCMSQKIRLLYLNVKPENGVCRFALSKAINKEDVLEYIQSQAGKKFDPRVVEKFIVMIKAQKLIYQR